MGPTRDVYEHGSDGEGLFTRCQQQALRATSVDHPRLPWVNQVLRTYSFYHMVSGVVHQKRFSTEDDRASALAANTPTDHVSMERVLDPLSQRVDVVTGAVVDCGP